MVNETARIAAGDCSHAQVKCLPHGDYRAEFGELIGAGPTRAAACRAIADHAAIRCCAMHPHPFTRIDLKPNAEADWSMNDPRRRARR